jgi:hypothetical protein
MRRIAVILRCAACWPSRLLKRRASLLIAGVVAEGGPVLVRLVAQIAARFGVVVTQKLAAQAVPVIGAFGGAVVNYAFIDHLQEIARAHFTVRRLERRYGKEAVRMAYEKLSGATPSGGLSIL